MSNHRLKFYPVSNGDTVLITLKDETTILFDSNIRDTGEDSDGNQIYDVKKDLLSSLKKKNNNYHLDLFVLTHPDQDHCRGFKKHFYQGNPDNYGDVNRKADEIIIDEMWVTSLLFDNVTNDDAKAFKKEAERRRKLWDNDDKSKDKPGNKIRMIGYNGDNKYENVPNNIPGETQNEINGSKKTDFEFFIHSPFKASLVTASAQEDANFSSIVVQARFKANASDKNFCTYVLLGGDADHNIWAKIWEVSTKNYNKDKLEWDLFLASHHCSWTYFNNVPYDDKEENKTPKDTSLKILDKKVANGQIIASCKLIKKNDDNPPHYQAKVEYIKKLNKKEDFIELAKEPKESEPKPVIYKVTTQGPVREDKSQQGSAMASAGGGINTVKRGAEYGAKKVL
jgi:hypothetical protein